MNGLCKASRLDKMETHPTGQREKQESSTMNVKPLGDKLLVQRTEAQTKTDSGIYLPESATDKPKEGTVIAVGDGRLNHDSGERVPFTVSKGDRVIFTSYAGTEIKFEDNEYLIMTEDDILGIID